MNTVIIRKNKSSKEDEFEQAFEKLLSCLPPYKEIDYFLDLVRRHGSFDEKYSREPSLIILGSSIPEELIYAVGAVPYWLFGGSRTLSVFADDTVPRDTDPVSRSMLGSLQGGMGDFPKEALILIPLINDSSRKLAYILKAKGHRVHTVYIPPTQGKASDGELFRQGEILTDVIYQYTGKRITRKRLLEAQEKIEEARRQIKYFVKLTSKKPELFPSIWRLFLLHSYYCTENLEDWSNHMRMLNNQLATADVQKSGENASSVLLLGSPVYFPNYKIPFLIHDVKLHLAAQLDYTTEKFLRPYHMDKKMTLETLMQGFYKRDCSSAYTENKPLFGTVSRLLSKMQIDGVVYHVLKGQIEYDFELERLEELFSAHSIPVCRLETDYSYQDIEQLRIRLEAFQEVLTQRKFRKEAQAV